MSSESSIAFPDLPRSELERAIGDLLDKAKDVLTTQGRLRNLLSATRAIAEDLDLSVMLTRITRAAVDLVGAQYGALGVIAPDGSLEQFIHVGLSPEQADAIGHLPRGHGILGAVITDASPVRLEHLSEDPRSVGFPELHPPMSSFVGVPIRVRGEVYGNLYLTNRSDGAFSSEDEELLTALAAAAGVAIDNARLFGETERRQRWAFASADVSGALLNDDGTDPLRVIADSIIGLTDASAVILITQTPAGALVSERAWGEAADDFAGRVFPFADSVAGQVIASGNPVLSLGVKHPASVDSSVFTGPAMFVPLERSAGRRGALALIRAAGASRFLESDLDMVTEFAAHASVALELREAREVRERVALLEDRSRIARDLHDNVIQRLFAAGLSLNGIDVQGVPSGAQPKIELVSGLLDEAIAEIRKSVFALRAAEPRGGSARHRLLNVVGESAAMFTAAPRLVFEGDLDGLASDDVLEDLEAVVREGLSNAARHADATAVTVTVHAAADLVGVRVADDGRGVQGRVRASGTANLEDRARRWGGRSSLRTAESGGAVLEWEIPTPRRDEVGG
ncbi:MAG: two-component system, histidine kinase [Naasia sp.]|jgi:signal transduction histidine kinase|uniref:sensor histidine kinase n=1 Tax=Naasia sp. TaxID=2546198 RepID=UPI00260E571A|nr:GAF domain-containing protein [Naasia sp.]MCU1570492.1 two-component system, histidine kinase [Naasia sp.]